MSFLSLLRLETVRLFSRRLTWIVVLGTILSPLLGLFLYRPLFSISQNAYSTTTTGTYLANPAFAGAIGGVVLFGVLILVELNRIHKNGFGSLADTIVSPLSSNLVRIVSVVIVSIVSQIITIIVHLPYTIIKTGLVFDAKLYVGVYLVFMLCPILLSIMFSASAYQITRNIALSACLLVTFMMLSFTVWSNDYLLRWINPSVFVLSDVFGNSRIMQTVLYNRLCWFLLLTGIWVLSFLCIRKYGKGILGSFVKNSRRFYFPIIAFALIATSIYSYFAQPFLDQSLSETDTSYEDPTYVENIVCKSVHIEAIPDVNKGTYHATTTYTICNNSGKSQEAVFYINPGYQVSSVMINDKLVSFSYRKKYIEARKEIQFTLPSDKDIKLKLEYGGMPQEWNIQNEMQGAKQVSKDYINVGRSLEPANMMYDSEQKPLLTAHVILPSHLRPVPFGTSTFEKIGENNNGLSEWQLDDTGYSLRFYASNYISNSIKAAGVNIDFFYNAKHQSTMEKAKANETIKQVFEYCSTHYGPLYFSEDNYMKIIELSAFMAGGYAGPGSSVMDENSFNEESLKDTLKGGGGSDVIAHEIIHQWWGLYIGFDGEGTAGWSSEALTVYTAYRLMKDLYGEEYAKTKYIDIWQREVDNYFQNFYVRNPEYLNRLPEKFQDKISNNSSMVQKYCLFPLKMLKAEKLVGGEEKMDKILSKLFNELEDRLLTYDIFLKACGLSEEDLKIV